MTYSRKPHPTTPGGAKAPAEESGRSLPTTRPSFSTRLVSDGLFDLADTGGQKFPNHYVQATVGRWKATLFPKEMPDAVMKPLRPLIETGKAASRKKP